jgi:L-malate glycosyltransferase
VKINQITPSLFYGDAVGNEIIALDRLFTDRGHSSRIFSLTFDEGLSATALPLSAFAKFDDPDAINILHFAVASQASATLTGARGRKWLIYHNVTPPEFLQPYNQAIADHCSQSLEQIAELAGQVDLGLGDSRFNCEDLEKMGFSKTAVLPYLYDPDSQVQPEPDPFLMQYYDDGAVNIFALGRRAPNKKFEDVIKSYYFFRKFQPDSRLILVGNPRGFEYYDSALRGLVGELELEGVRFFNKVTDSELEAIWLRADLYLHMSEHEGFCVPLLESYRHAVPVVAFDAGAVAETSGAGAIVFAQKNFPEIGAAMHRVVTDETLRTSLIKGGRRRLDDFSGDRVGAVIDQLLSETGNG